ncbi:MAG: mechanosensitive ion channel [Microcella sp.]|nr:mechanosensitive ion channel [Microcella sp.]
MSAALLPVGLSDVVDGAGLPDQGWLFFVVLTALTVAVAIVLLVLVEVVVRLTTPRHPWTAVLLRHIRVALRLLLLGVAVQVAVSLAAPVTRFSEALDRILTIGVIAMFTWMLVDAVDFAFEGGKGRFAIGAEATRAARRANTQLTFLQRLATVIIIIVGVSAALLTFPQMQALGASLLASAGLAGIIAGLAAQSTLSNVFAGVQIAFSDAIRVDDIVIVEGEWGRIEEITLTYVVVRIWDDRRLVVPSTHFTSTPFENWTRTGSELLGSVELDLDWRVSPAAMRERLKGVLEGTALWDARVSVLQVADAVGGLVRVRILVSAADAGSLFDLRNYVREQLVEWVQLESPGAMPRTRVLMVEGETADDEAPHIDPADESARQQLFSGTPEAQQRAQQMMAPSADPDAPSRAGA